MLSHLGSASEISAALVRRGLDGDMAPPQRDQIAPVWARWDALGPEEQRDGWHRADQAHRQLSRAITTEEASHLLVPYFAGPMLLADYAGHRLSEQAVHGWDMAVALRPTATIPAEDLELLWERLDLIVSRFHDKEALARIALQRIRIHLLYGGKDHDLVLGDGVHLAEPSSEAPTAVVTGTSDAVLRPFYGRSRPRDAIAASWSSPLDHLITLFPGF